MSLCLCLPDILWRSNKNVSQLPEEDGKKEETRARGTTAAYVTELLKYALGEKG